MDISPNFQPFFFNFFLRLKQEVGIELDIDQYEDFLTCWLTYETNTKEELRYLCETFFLSRPAFRPAFNRLFDEHFTLFENITIQKDKHQQNADTGVKSAQSTDIPKSEKIPDEGESILPESNSPVNPVDLVDETLEKQKSETKFFENKGWKEFNLVIKESSDGKGTDQDNQAGENNTEDANVINEKSFIFLPEKALPFSIRKTTQTWRKLATHFSQKPTDQVNVKALVRQLIEEGFIHRLEYQTEKTEHQQIVWLSDHEGSMNPFAAWEYSLLRAITNTPPTLPVLPHTDTFVRYFFHDYPTPLTEKNDFQLFINPSHTEAITWTKARLEKKWNKHTLVVVYSDAAAAHRKLDFDRVKIFYDFCTLIRLTTSRLLWINPVRQTDETSAQYIGYFVEMVYPDDLAFKRYTSRLPALSVSERDRLTELTNEIDTENGIEWPKPDLMKYASGDSLSEIRIEAFQEEGLTDAHVWLACHAAFPVALTTDLLQHIWLNFRTDEAGTAYPIPLSTVDEVLHSPLLREIGRDLYELYPDIRQILLQGLREAWGIKREKRLAVFMEKYLDERRSEVPTRALAAAEEINHAIHTSTDLTKKINELLKNSQDKTNSQWLEAKSQIEYLLSVAGSRTAGAEDTSLPDPLKGLHKLNEGNRLAQQGKDQEAAMKAFQEALPFVEQSETEGGFKVKLPPEVQEELLRKGVEEGISEVSIEPMPAEEEEDIPDVTIESSEPFVESDLNLDGSVKKIYALLVGINSYARVRKLSGCLNDVKAIRTYLEQNLDIETEILELTDAAATRVSIADGFRNFLNRASKEDTVLFYFSGHGTRELADPIWDETDGALECIVCYDGGTTKASQFLLTDKELRFLIHELSMKTKSHIVTIFDCCFSGDNTRNGSLIAASYGEVNERRITDRAGSYFQKRDWEEFLFSDVIRKSSIHGKKPADFLPEGVQVRMFASESDEMAVEIAREGIFTKTLIKTLVDSRSNLSYAELNGRMRQYMRASYEQTPRLILPVNTKKLLNVGFLNTTIDPYKRVCEVTRNTQEGWQLNAGAIHGLKPNSRVTVFDAFGPNTQYDAIIRKGGIFIDYALLALAGPDPDRSYKADVLDLTSEPFRLELRNHDGNPNEIRQIVNALQQASVYCVFSDRHEADFTLHFRSGEAYFTFPDDPYRPLIRPIEVINQDPWHLVDAFQHISRWHFIKNLKNEDQSSDFPAQPLSIELSRVNIDGTSTTINLSNDTAVLDYEKVGDVWKGTIQIKVTNTTHQDLYVCAAYLNKEFECFLKFIPERVKLLQAGASMWLGYMDRYGRTKDRIDLKIGAVEREYNWPQTEEALKFIISTEEFEVEALELEELPTALTSDDRRKDYYDRGSLRGFDKDETHLFFSGWGTQTLNLVFRNPVFNHITPSTLNMLLEWDETAYFAAGLYYDVESDESGQPTIWKIKEGIVMPEDEKGLLDDRRLFLGNIVETAIRKRRYRIMKKDQYRLRIVAIGDSWFQYPILLKDILDLLYKRFAIRSFAEAGDTLANYIKRKEYLDAIGFEEAKFFLISGGLNELLGDEFNFFLRETPDPSDTTPIRYLNEKFFDTMTTLSNQYDGMFTEMLDKYQDLQIMVHCYDYIIPVDTEVTPKKQSWSGKHMIKIGIKPQAEREKLIRYIMDEFAGRLTSLASKPKFRGKVNFVDTRGLVAREEWYDELHPNNEGFQKIADKFIREIERIRTQQNL
jgi:uncharacterized protein with von Willebrand factor type A (vWA) domain